MNEAQRLGLLFWSPGAAFADIVRKPRWYVPMILVIAAALVFMSLVSSRVGWEELARDQILASSRTQNLSGADLERAVQQSAKFWGIFAYLGPLIGTPIYVALVAAVLLLFYAVFMGANARFSKVFGIVAYAQVPALLSTALAIVVLHITPPEDFDINNPVGLNLGFYMPETMPKWLTGMLSSIDLPTFWIMALMVIGLRAIDPKASRGKAVAAVFLPWGIWVLGKTALAAMFS
jgi:hypothetical protein